MFLHVKDNFLGDLEPMFEKIVPDSESFVPSFFRFESTASPVDHE